MQDWQWWSGPQRMPHLLVDNVQCIGHLHEKKEKNKLLKRNKDGENSHTRTSAPRRRALPRCPKYYNTASAA